MFFLTFLLMQSSIYVFCSSTSPQYFSFVSMLSMALRAHFDSPFMFGTEFAFRYSCIPVSYTHLDVYKRQLHDCDQCWRVGKKFDRGLSAITSGSRMEEYCWISGYRRAQVPNIAHGRRLRNNCDRLSGFAAKDHKNFS